jgi:hypothetical protein
MLAFWDREEDVLVGSEHYVDHPLAPLSRTVGYVNFDIQGANVLPSLRNTSFAAADQQALTEIRADAQRLVDEGRAAFGPRGLRRAPGRRGPLRRDHQPRAQARIAENHRALAAMKAAR